MSQYYILPGKVNTIEKGGADYVKYIIELVCREWKCTPDRLSTKRNMRDYSEPFHVTATLILEFTTVKREVIAEMFGRKRSMTYHAEKSVKDLEFSNLKFREKMTEIRMSLTQTFYNLQNPVETLELIEDVQ